ncbi:DNA polymerase III subunit gamma/tau [Brevibacillus panacihumi]|uniref:DNA polymerase III subunit gamma/tau n=1 Tax=Brevibacillus panacihumi TaxID=497735 RepID=A0A3M8CNS1_9BACL|nr:DNA polymerase III subunit gamma/tau [Brevibacillus panacihumi]RNB77402.1 DNA polymerase III subunit gamma/tau [Brevibacillus panacihumi]
MHKRELLLGFGAGVLVATAVIGLFVPKPASVSTPITAEQMKAAADGMDMVVLTKEEYEQLQGEKKVSVKPAATPPTAPEKPESADVAEPVVDPVSAPAVTQPKHSAAAQVPVVATAAPAPAPAEAVTPEQPVLASFTIPYKATAESVSKILVQEKILPENNGLVDELRSQNKLNRIRVGTYEIAVPATEKDIVKLITTPPKK